MQSGDVGEPRVGRGQGSEPDHGLVRDPQRPMGGREDPARRGRGGQVEQHAGGSCDSIDLVDDKQRRRVSQPGPDGLLGRGPGGRARPERGGHEIMDQSDVIGPGQVDERGAAGPRPRKAPGCLDRQPGLSEPAPASDRDQANAGLAKPAGNIEQLRVTPHEGRADRRQRDGGSGDVGRLAGRLERGCQR